MADPPGTWMSGYMGLRKWWLFLPLHPRCRMSPWHRTWRRCRESLPESQPQVNIPPKERVLIVPASVICPPSTALGGMTSNTNVKAHHYGWYLWWEGPKDHPLQREVVVCWWRSLKSVLTPPPRTSPLNPRRLAWFSHLVIWKSRRNGIKYTFHSHGLMKVG